MKLRLFALLALVMTMALAVNMVFVPQTAQAETAQVAVFDDEDDDDDDKGGPLLKNINVSGSLSDGGSFEGKLTITGFALTDDGTTLLADGSLKGKAITANGKKHNIKHDFSGIPLSLASAAAAVAPAQSSCSILTLDLGPLFLDLLGLEIDLSEINLDITGQTGEGKLLGNLLCALAGLLDPQ